MYDQQYREPLASQSYHDKVKQSDPSFGLFLPHTDAPTAGPSFGFWSWTWELSCDLSLERGFTNLEKLDIHYLDTWYPSLLYFTGFRMYFGELGLPSYNRPNLTCGSQGIQARSHFVRNSIIKKQTRFLAIWKKDDARKFDSVAEVGMLSQWKRRKSIIVQKDMGRRG